MGVRQCFKSKNSTQLAGDEGRKCTEWTSMRALSGQNALCILANPLTDFPPRDEPAEVTQSGHNDSEFSL
ncbi:hypothetical protein N7534_010283 [Penicillium rubens]|nr:hypothetical protein N7534_010283 [Penicillium rubens]